MSESLMTRADLFDWIMAHGCNQQPLYEYKAKVIYFINPKTGAKAWLNLPIDERPVRDYTIYRICLSLQIPIPTQSDYMKEIVEKINDQFKKKNQGRI